MTTPVNVSVNLDVLVEATGNVSVFGQAPTTISNVGAAAVTIPVSCLYNGVGNSLIKFQGTSAVLLDDIVASLSLASFVGTNATEAKLADAIKNVLQGAINTSTMVPFKDYGAAYHAPENFGSLALGSYAHSLFGHLAATAAIDNDMSFKNKMIGDGNGDAGLNKLLAGLIYGLSDTKCTAITKQVLGQDASRAKGIDNDANLPSGFQALEFRANDTVYFSIRLMPPTISVSNNAAATQQSTPSVGSLYTDPITYVLAVKLA
jgi:hypothetical protein